MKGQNTSFNRRRTMRWAAFAVASVATFAWTVGPVMASGASASTSLAHQHTHGAAHFDFAARTSLPSPSSHAKPGSPIARMSSSPNHAQNDQAMWNRASDALYIWAQAGDPRHPDASRQLLALKPGQTVYLFAYERRASIATRSVSWSVNSPDGRFTDYAGHWTFQVNGKPAAIETFRASQPGIYTIQAKVDGKYSVPLVLTVGVDQLRASAALRPNQQVNGVLPFTPPATDAPTQTAGGITFTSYPVQSGWIPLSGHTTAATRTLTVVLQSGQASWSYALPVAADGTFSALLHCPFHGRVHVLLFTDYLAQLNRQGKAETDAGYVVDNAAEAMPALDQALLATSQVDLNLPGASDLSDEAAALMQHAPSVSSGIAAISNYVSERMSYDYTDFDAGKHVYEDAVQAWNARIGVCENYAEVTAAMLRSIGIPVETVIGDAHDRQAAGSHEWLRAWTGTHWMAVDPTWDNAGQTADTVLTNAYLTDTTAFSTSHTARQIGTAW